MLAELRRILQRGTENPSELAESIKQFLVTYDSLPEETVASAGVPWRTLERLAYELRYYVPNKASDETLLDDEEALKQIREALTEIS